MANFDGPRGFTPVQGQELNVIEYDVDADTATAIFIGDLAKLATDGKADVMAAASDDYIGPIVGLKNSSGQMVSNLAASTAGKMLVATNPLIKLICSTEDGGTALTQAAIGDCADAIWTHAGSTSTGLSGTELSETLVGDGNSAQFRILEKLDIPDNDWSDHHIKLVVVAKEHAFLTTSAAI